MDYTLAGPPAVPCLAIVRTSPNQLLHKEPSSIITPLVMPLKTSAKFSPSWQTRNLDCDLSAKCCALIASAIQGTTSHLEVAPFACHNTLQGVSTALGKEGKHLTSIQYDAMSSYIGGHLCIEWSTAGCLSRWVILACLDIPKLARLGEIMSAPPMCWIRCVKCTSHAKPRSSSTFVNDCTYKSAKL